MQDISQLTRLVGSFFYSSLTDENNRRAIATLLAGQTENPVKTENTAKIENTEKTGNASLDEAFCHFLSTLSTEHDEALKQDFFLLFEGAGPMPAPPWGSVYRDQENILFGESTVRYRTFLQSHNIVLDTGVCEPEDQFGLMLMAASQLVEAEADVSALAELFGVHLLPWCFRYLELVENNAQTKTYQSLACLARLVCEHLENEFAITAETCELYY